MKKKILEFLAIFSALFVIGNKTAFSQGAGCDSLNTLYAYSYLNHGAMFNVIANSQITLDHLTANIINGTAYYQIYYKTGSFLGYETQPSAWTLIDSVLVTSNNTLTINNTPTVIPINLNLTMNPGDTVALYFVSEPLSKVYLTTTTTPWGNIFVSDSNISISISRSVYQLFGVPFSTPQNWNGTVSYCPAQTSAIEAHSPSQNERINIFKSGNQLTAQISSDIENSCDNLELSLYDVLSRKVLSMKVTTGINLLDLSSLPAGVYTCIISTHNRVLKTAKIY